MTGQMGRRFLGVTERDSGFVQNVMDIGPGRETLAALWGTFRTP